MTTPEIVKRRRKASWLIGILTISTLVFLVFLQSSNFWKSFSIETASDLILLYILSSVNFIAFVIFLFIFLRNIVKLSRERRSSVLGAQIKTRLLMYFFAVSLLPIFAMAVFSYLFMNRALERWFSQIPQNVIREARDIEENAAVERERQVLRLANVFAATLAEMPSQGELESVATAAGVEYLQVSDRSGHSISIVADASKAETLGSFAAAVKQKKELKKNDRYVGAFAANGPFEVVAVQTVTMRPGVPNIAETSLAELERLSEQQKTIRRIGMLTLGILTFLLISASSWIAFYIARGITTPIKALAEGADEISRGNLGYKVEVQAEDELALLVDAFNAMSGRLEESSKELEGRRKYIETLLKSLPTGVISVTAEGEVNTANDAARKIIGLSDEAAIISVDDLDRIAVGGEISRLIARARRSGRASGQAVIGGLGDDIHVTTPQERTIAIIATALPDSGGVVLVLEDLTELISAQRASAWQEVARRMAHEIKNPLTPIQLSAERIAKRFDSEPNGDAQIGSVVKESTGTILREVSSLKAMVDEFSRFARLPEAELVPGDLNDVIIAAAELYRERKDEIAVEMNLGEDLPSVRLDPEQLKRVFVNLIDNAIEAPGGPERKVAIATRHDAAREIIVAEVADNGDGIEPADLQKLFQPYFSTKGRGTGLGLAIVQRIISEHNGRIFVTANQPRGAKLIVELPIAA